MVYFTKETFDDDAKRQTVAFIRQAYHEDAAAYDDPGKPSRVIHAVAARCFEQGTSDMKWGLRKLKKMYAHEEKTEFGTRRRVFSGVVVKDTSQGRAVRTDFTSNVPYREQQAPLKVIEPAVPKSAHSNSTAGAASTSTSIAAVSSAGGETGATSDALKRKRVVGEPVTMREKLEARKRVMMSWEEFKEKNLGDLKGGKEEEMLRYRQELDAARAAAMAEKGSKREHRRRLEAKKEKKLAKKRKRKEKKRKKKEKKKRKRMRKREKQEGVGEPQENSSTSSTSSSTSSSSTSSDDE